MIGGYFERTSKGFKISKDQFGEGNYKLHKEGFEIKILDKEEEIAKTNISEFQKTNKLENINQELLTQIVEGDDKGVFLEVVGGSDSLKQFIRRLMKEEELTPN